MPTASNQFSFADEDALINLGTSWWIDDYPLQVRTLIHEKRVHYIPFVHDCIPLMAPEHCAEDLARQFRSALSAMLHSADGFLVNSFSTARDLEKAARESGLSQPEIHVVQLNGDIRTALVPVTPEQARAAVHQLFDQVGFRTEILDGVGYAVCVSTLESRKNHLLLFQAWDMMIARRGLEASPCLICVGRPGWLFEAPQTYLKARPYLAERIKFLDNVDDASLAALYTCAKFTVYPSLYEGWGLPVTEALCFGRATACSNASSLPEAGGAFVDYFDPLAPRDAFEVIDRLAFDHAHRRLREEAIARSYRARSWADIAAQALDSVTAIVARRSGETRKALPPRLELRKFYIMMPRGSGSRALAYSAEDFRVGGGWHRCETWGAWTRARRAVLRFSLAEPPIGAIALYVQLIGASDRQIAKIGAAQSREAFEIGLARNATTIARVVFTDGLPPNVEQRLFIDCSELVDLSEVTEGRDKRRVGCGLVSFGLCREYDLTGRIAMLEAINASARIEPAGKTATL
jgi:glycosyltransferase involved in cell wall biosynthesis